MPDRRCKPAERRSFELRSTDRTICQGCLHVARRRLDALAGLKPRLLQDLERLPGARILEGNFTAVQQAIGTAKANAAGAAFLRAFVEDAKASGLVARLIERHRVRGLAVAPPG